VPARASRTLQPSLAAVRDAAWGALDVVRRGDLAGRIDFARSAMPGLSKTPFFVAELLFTDDLARDLRPAVLVPLSTRPVRADMAGRVFSVATIAPRPAADHTDKLFRDMWSWTHDAASHVEMPEPLLPGAPLLDHPSLRLECQRDFALPDIGAGDNDGVVSTQRQLLGEPHRSGDRRSRGRPRSLPARLGARRQGRRPGPPHQRRRVRDDDFFLLLGRVAHRIAKVLAADA